MKIYLSGGMTNLSFDESNMWRCEVEKYFRDNNVEIFNPVIKNKLEDNIGSMRYDLDKLNQADLVVVNFNNQKSIGTAFELGYAYERRIPIIGLNETGERLHTWLSSCCVHVFTDMNEMLDFVKNYYVEY